MTLLGTLTFLGLAVVSLDVLGGVIAAALLARGTRPVRLLIFLASYAVIVLIATLVMQPLLQFAGRLLHPLLGSLTALAVIQLLVGVVLAGLCVHQARASLRPPRPPKEASRQRRGGLVAGGALFSLTILCDPTYAIAVGMSTQVDHLVLRGALLVLWNGIYQAPLLIVTALGLLGVHEPALEVCVEFLSRHRVRLLHGFSALLGIAAALVLADAIIALAIHSAPWVHGLLLL